MLPRSSAPKSDSRSSRNTNSDPEPHLVEPFWGAMIPPEQWSVYQRAMAAVRATGIEFLLGGGFALAHYTQHWRNTKDIDFYVLPEQRSLVMEALTQAGFVDYYPTLAYDRGWIYRSTAGGVIVDIIWSMANRRAEVDAQWFERASPVQIRGEKLYVLPAEELVWSKLYVLQHDHCDWPDILNVVYAYGEKLDWEHLLKRVNGDVTLLKALATLFDWLCPNRPEAVPKAVRSKLCLPKPETVTPEYEHDRVRLLDSRAWFAGQLPKDKQLEI